jgi:hypothetical protein
LNFENNLKKKKKVKINNSFSGIIFEKVLFIRLIKKILKKKLIKENLFDKLRSAFVKQKTKDYFKK